MIKVQKLVFNSSAILIAGLSVLASPSALAVDTDPFIGKRIPPPPPAPDLSRVKFGAPITLFNGKNLDGWKLTSPSATSGWSVEDGLLVNRPIQEEGKPHRSYGNLRTEREFEDFNIT